MLSIVPLLCSRALLFIYPISINLDLLIPNFQSSPNPPLATASLFSMSASQFLFHRYVHWCHILDSTYKWYHMVFVFLFLTPFTYDNLQVHACCWKWRCHYFILLKTEEHFTVSIYHIFFICSSVEGWLGCFCVLAIQNSAAMNIEVHVSFNMNFLWMYSLEWDCWIT